VVSRILRFRAGNPDLFDRGGYEPLLSTGPKADCICGFSRINDNQAIVVVTARFPARRETNPEWHGTTLALPQQLAAGTFRNILTGGRLSASDIEVAIDLVFDALPVAVLVLDSQT